MMFLWVFSKEIMTWTDCTHDLLSLKEQQIDLSQEASRRLWSVLHIPWCSLSVPPLGPVEAAVAPEAPGSRRNCRQSLRSRHSWETCRTTRCRETSTSSSKSSTSATSDWSETKSQTSSKVRGFHCVSDVSLLNNNNSDNIQIDCAAGFCSIHWDEC